MDKNRLLYLAKKKFDNTITPGEQQELAMLMDGVEDAELKPILEKIWETFEPVEQMPVDMHNRILSNLFSKPQTSTVSENISCDASIIVPPVRRMSWWKYAAGIAAVVLSVLLVGWWVMAPTSINDVVSNHLISAEKGSRLKAMLPDGTIVWLNAGSHLEYDGNFGKTLRSVSLTGEAFFDVTHNKEKPFIIHTSAMDIRVLGTTFNVRAYPEEKRTEAALITGSLQVSFINQAAKTIILKPAEKISVANDGIIIDSTGSASISTVKTDPKNMTVTSVTYEPRDSSIVETSWVNNKLVFRGKTFEEVSSEMSRWYNVNFEVHDKTLLKKRFTGTFETETIHEALTRISESYNFSFTYDSSRKLVTISK